VFTRDSDGFAHGACPIGRLRNLRIAGTSCAGASGLEVGKRKGGFPGPAGKQVARIRSHDIGAFFLHHVLQEFDVILTAFDLQFAVTTCIAPPG
jgi:hypothetical protein